MSRSWVENTSKHIQSLGMELVVTVTRENERSLQVRPSWFLVGLCRVTGVTCQSEDPEDTTLA